MAAAVSNPSRKVAGAVVGAAALGYGAYYASQAKVVSTLERDREDLETKVFVSQSKARRADLDAQEAEALSAALRQQADIDAAAATELGHQLEAARAQVQQLEAQQQQRRESAARARELAAGAAERLEQLKKDVVRFRWDAAEADKALGIAAAEVAAARQRMANPLRHPYLQQLRGGGGR